MGPLTNQKCMEYLETNANRLVLEWTKKDLESFDDGTTASKKGTVRARRENALLEARFTEKTGNPNLIAVCLGFLTGLCLAFACHNCIAMHFSRVRFSYNMRVLLDMLTTFKRGTDQN